ncbi:MAG: DUF3667 domain-containing protein [Flavobacteriales bacterium]|nr:DUF3667 domain-containing protein [Flavobacteriales bacterium]
MASNNKVCSNCHAPIKAAHKFCATCGQEQRNLHIGFWELIKEYVSDNFNFDTRLMITLKYLLFKPGLLTQEFSAGRRASYVPPIRLYLFISFIGFLVMGFDVEDWKNWNTKPTKKENATLSTDSTITNKSDSGFVTLKGSNPDLGAEIDLIIPELELEESSIALRLVTQLSRLLDDPDKHGSQFRDEFYKNLSLSMFFLMPVFALLMWLMWGKPRPFYIDTVIFSLHLHSFIFLLLIISNLVSLLIDSDWLDPLVVILTLSYLIFGLKRLKNISTFRAIGNTVGLSLVYLLIVVLTMFIIGVISIWLF